VKVGYAENPNSLFKISDFGLCCRSNEESSYYMATTRQRLPVRWMSIEALSYEKFSEKSDV
jgi:hypothetical protein